MICMTGFGRHPSAALDQRCAAVMRCDDPKLTYFPVTAACGVVYYAGPDSYRA